jgi:hypothetical protein
LLEQVGQICFAPSSGLAKRGLVEDVGLIGKRRLPCHGGGPLSKAILPSKPSDEAADGPWPKPDYGPARAALRRAVRAPGDKSISHRALILGALAHGETEIEGLLEGDDVLRTAAAMRAFGAASSGWAPGRWRVEGQRRLRRAGRVIDCGNAGTGVRLIMGAAAGFPSPPPSPATPRCAAGR